MDFLNYLKDAQLVADFQKFFGIQSLELIENKKLILDSPSSDDSNQDNLFFKPSKINGISKRTDDRSSSKKAKAIKNKHYVISNLGFYYLFCFGASLGYETFYALFYPFFLNNIDSYVARKLIVIWSIVMYIGQALKDIIRWNRPKSPPVVVLEPEYSMEYGMPSTHAMVGFSLPFSIFIFTLNRYVYAPWIGFAIATIWCLLVCGSRLYLGMHTVLDILVGVILSAIILGICVPLIDIIDELHFKNTFSPLVSFIVICLMSIYYPKSDRWSPARGDTCVMIGFSYGVLIGTWINYQFGIMTDPISSSPFEIHLPNIWTVFIMIIRTIIVAISIESTRIFGKKVLFRLLCKMQNLDYKDTESVKKPSVEVPLKLITYSLVGSIVANLLPLLYKYLNLEL